MKLKLWQKCFLLTFTVFFVLINVCLSMWCVFDLKSDFSSFASNCIKDAEHIMELDKHLVSDSIDDKELQKIAESYKQRQIYMRFEISKNELVNTLPCDVEDIYSIGKVTNGNDSYYYVYLSHGDCQLGYMKSMETLTSQKRSGILKLLIVDIVVALMVGALLYCAMRKIYKPVSNISHELRTPLTSILGYSQLLANTSISDDNKEIARERIESNARYMNDIIEQLLTLDSLKETTLVKKKVNFEELLSELKALYPSVSFANNVDYINCDEVLIKMLLSNLLNNAVREDSQTAFTAEANEICISNRALISPEELKCLNGSSNAGLTIKGNGLGVDLCREIIKAHAWSLNYTFEDGVLSATIRIR